MFCRRRKMLILSILLIGVILIRDGQCISLNYIFKKQGNLVEPSCIAEDAERYSAIGWVYPFPQQSDQLPSITTKFIPTINNEFNCNFSKNDVCNNRWTLKNWQIEEKFDFISDGRWDDFPTILITETSKQFKESIEIKNELKLGFSVRASNYVELFVCTGWDPFNYPCYYINMNSSDIYLNKYVKIPKEIIRERPLDDYKAYSNILPDNEWRNFIISLNESGTLTLTDMNVNRDVIQFTDKEPLKPLYFFMRSKAPSLWKIHQNHFLYSKNPQVTRLGPQIKLNSKDLCVSLYVSTCDECEMTFFMQNQTLRKVLKHVESTKNKWINIKIKQENIQTDKSVIFLETKFKNQFTRNDSLGNGDGFWAIDETRICNENEVKVTYLKLNEDYKDNDNISCQIVHNPNWRPKRFDFNEIKGFPEIQSTVNSTSIKLEWNQEDPQNRINYFISYQANDICPKEYPNLKRLKSNGFIVTKYNEVFLNNLIPYTDYNITVATVLHQKEKHLKISTAETVSPTISEIPNKVQLHPSDTEVNIKWDPIDCTSKYGHLFYSLIIENTLINFTIQLTNKVETDYVIEKLLPFTKYKLKILTHRTPINDTRKIDRGNVSVLQLEFSTMPGLATSVENLELYSIDESSASLRFDLPDSIVGIPESVQVIRCNVLSFSKCKSQITSLEHCKLWPKKYCVDVNYLIPFQKYALRLSLKNRNTHTFGNETVVETKAVERIPGAPSNITYRIVDCDEATEYCHLNVSWLHPYYQSGEILSFNIVLNSTNIVNGTEEVKSIREIYRVENKTYLPQYTYQIKYIPYSTKYNIYIQSVNKLYKSNFTTSEIQTDHIGDHIDQSPKLMNKTATSAAFKLPHLDPRLAAYNVLVVVQDYDKNTPINKHVISNNKKIADNLCHSNNYGDIWIAYNITIKNNLTRTISVGKSDNNYKDEIVKSINNRNLQPNSEYCVIFIITNTYKNKMHDVVYYEKFQTDGSTKSAAIVPENSSSQNTHLYGLLVLLLLVPIGYLVYRYIKKRKRKPIQNENVENVYESLPFEECDDNFVNNITYDQLIHK